MDHFSRFSLPRSYAIDAVGLEAAYRLLRRDPGTDEGSRAAPLDSAAEVDEAYRILLDPVLRAEYLLHLAGVDTTHGRKNEDDDFAARQLGRREVLAAARSAGDGARIVALLEDLGHESDRLESALAARLEHSAWAAAVPILAEMKHVRGLACDASATLADLDA